MSKPRIAVIGAGIAGLTCARELEQSGADVIVFEKSRSLGGRLATRRQDGLAFDHGAQYITARSRPFARYIDGAKRRGNVASWRPRVGEDERQWDAPFGDWLIGMPGMNALVRPLAARLRVRAGTRVHEIFRTRNGWRLQTDAGREREVFDAVAAAVPAPQALTLLAAHSQIFRHLTKVRMSPCWSVMIRFENPPPARADAIRWTSGPISWAASDSTKPGRLENSYSWVIHASAGWSQEHLEADSQEAAQLLLREFSLALGEPLPPPVFLVAHRWRHALVEQPLGLPCMIEEDIVAGACGDWCIAPRVEAAFESGRALAHSFISLLGLATPKLMG